MHRSFRAVSLSWNKKGEANVTKTGATGGGTGHGIGQVDEELGDAGPLQEGAEDDEHHDELGAHADGAAEDAVEGVEHGADDLIEGHLEICTAAQVEEGVHQQHTGHAQDRQAHAPAAQLHQGQDTDEADNHVQVVLHDPGGHLDHVLGIDGVEKVGAGPGNQQHDVIPGHVVDPLVPFFGREGQEAEQQDQPHEHGQPNLLPGGKEHSVDDAVGGERYHQPADHQLRQTLPDPGVGLPTEVSWAPVSSGGTGSVLCFLNSAIGSPLISQDIFQAGTDPKSRNYGGDSAVVPDQAPPEITWWVRQSPFRRSTWPRRRDKAPR